MIAVSNVCAFQEVSVPSYECVISILAPRYTLQMELMVQAGIDVIVVTLHIAPVTSYDQMNYGSMTSQLEKV
jgi:hypothetical protein